MQILIVEDETAAYENLFQILTQLDSSIRICGNTESINQTVNWLLNNKLPDLIFMDIHLSDGSAFSIFDKIKLEVPIIFTTAYDQYAINAFKVNSIDYLLKPIKVEEVKTALEKFKRLNRQDILQYLSGLTNLSLAPSFRDKLLVPQKDKLLPVNVSEICFFYTTDKNTRIFLKNGEELPYSKTLEQIETTLNPIDFFRANKQFIVARDCVNNITIWFDNRLLLSVEIEPPERIYVSKNKASEFKTWFVGKY